MQMKNIDKKKLLIAVAVTVAIVALIWGLSFVLKPGIKKGTDTVGEFVVVAEDGTKVNTSEQLKKDKSVEGLQLTDITLRENGGISRIHAVVKNNTGADMEAFAVKLTVLDKSGSVMKEFKGKIASDVPNGGTGVMDAQILEDISNAYDFRIEKTEENAPAPVEE